MYSHVHKTLFLLLFFSTLSGLIHGQTLYNGDTVYFCEHYYNYFSHEYSRTDTFDGWAVIDYSDTLDLTIFFTSQYDGANSPVNGYINVWDGNPRTGTQLLHYTGASSDITLVAPSGKVTIQVHYNAYSTDTSYYHNYSFSFQWIRRNGNPSSSYPCNTSGSSSVSDIRYYNVTPTEADILWNSGSTSFQVKVNNQIYTVNGDSLHLSGLTPNTHYAVSIIPLNLVNFPCCAVHSFFYTAPLPHLGCPDVTNLRSDYVRGYYGNFQNPYLNLGILDSPHELRNSRHFVHTDTLETDPRTNNLLHTVCPGHNSSVRLGNYNTGGEAEALVYYLHVDTTLYSLIMLHYAAVLQNPGHVPVRQPRFNMEILDQNDSVIDSRCGAAEFMADTSLGWNVSSYGLWKDWTTVGINLTPYHGQDVRLRFTIRDCAEGGHFGYAYFTVDCQQPFANTEQCGTIDTNTLTAPDGFNYLWYYDSPSNPISTEQSVTCSTSEGNIHCRLSFIENPSCYITMDTYVSNYWPLAVIDTISTTDNGCDGFLVQFINRSTILGNDTLPLPNHPPCESALWMFGDGQFSRDYNPSHTYFMNGPTTVTLIVGLGGECFDTTTFVIDVPDAYVPVVQHLHTCDSLRWKDNQWYSNDTTGPSWRIRIYNACDTLYTLDLSILPSPVTTLETDTFCYNGGYYWHGLDVPPCHSADTLFHLLSDTLVAANSCDSIVLKPLVQLPPDRLAIQIDPDCGLGYYVLTAATENPYWIWSSSPPDSSLDGHTTDRQLLVFPDSTTTYILTSYYGDSLFCPTTTSRALSRPTFPRAQLTVNPGVITYEQNTLYAYDDSKKFASRQWTIVNHGTTHDTVPLPDSLRRITYPVLLEYDSITVILEVSNAYCVDTATHTLPIIRSALFAPNAFTPGIEPNSRFTIVCNAAFEAELTIYNRQGLQVFSTTDLDAGWDGSHNGTPCPQGAYVWHLRYRAIDHPEEWKTALGTVTLLR